MITSTENEKVKELTKLQQKKYRDETKTFIVEGEHLVEEAKKANQVLEIFSIEELSYPTTVVSVDVMKKITSLDSPPSMIALCKKEEKQELLGERFVLLDEIQDPGNLGTIIRSSLAFNIDTIILSKNCVDLYHPKVIRGTQGMMFHLNIITMDTKEAITKLKEKNIPIYGTSVDNGIIIKNLTQEEKEKYCLIMGNEGNGLSQEILNECDKRLYIPMNHKVESLNVGVACSIILYEMTR